MQEIWSFDFREIDNLPVDPTNDDEADLLPEDKVSREIGVFIKHEDFLD
jgi:hypothetical protein